MSAKAEGDLMMFASDQLSHQVSGQLFDQLSDQLSDQVRELAEKSLDG